MMDHALLEGRREEGELVHAKQRDTFRVLRNLASKESRTRRIRNRRIVNYRVGTIATLSTRSGTLLRTRHVSPRRNQIPL